MHLVPQALKLSKLRAIILNINELPISGQCHNVFVL
nr:MAG TPA: hypothetical protein [Caudoviricetes sp.]DAN31779.1 MAG TPA: hypothetical protein [Caudoviricetes sp.]